MHHAGNDRPKVVTRYRSQGGFGFFGFQYLNRLVMQPWPITFQGADVLNALEGFGQHGVGLAHRGRGEPQVEQRGVP